MIALHDPWFLLFLAVPPLFYMIRSLIGRVPRFCRGAAGAVDFSAAVEARAAGATWRVKTAWVPAAVGWAGFALAAAALARPVLPRIEIPVLSEGIDMAVVVDRSSSMVGTSPVQGTGKVSSEESPQSGDSLSLLDAVKDAACRFIRSRANDRVAVVAFARTPETLCPFTLDQEAVAAQLAALECVEPESEEDGTAIGAALAEAARLLDTSTAVSRAAILFTDGRENRFTIDPLIAARLCADLGVKVHTVVLDFGAEAAGAAPLDDTLHRRIAAITNGAFLPARGPEELVEALRFIDDLERSGFEGRSITLYDDLYRWALFPAFVLLLAAFALGRTAYGRVP